MEKFDTKLSVSRTGVGNDHEPITVVFSRFSHQWFDWEVQHP